MKIFSRNLFTMLILSIFLLTSCNNNKKSNVGTVKIGCFYLSVDYAPYLIAKYKHWFEDSLGVKGINVEYTQFQTLPTINEAFATGKIDVVFEAEPPAIIGKASGIDITIRDISCSLVQEVLVHQNSTIKTIADLKGKKIALLSGTSSHYGVLKMLKENGIKQNEVQILDMMFSDAKAAFESGQVDAWAAAPPLVEQEEIAGTGRTLPRGDAFINSIMAVRGGFIKNHSDVFVTIDNVFNKAKDWLLLNQDSAIIIVSIQLNVPVDVIKLAWPRHNWKVKLNQKIIDDIQNKADFLKEIGKIQHSVKVKDDLIPFYSK
ncbi:MAG: aliphatic sulfonate ABC transporter substrate-binding protein [Bacteroidetes bacterium]|nr:aliphatic sulfonate ABC transporter substrate-binding protein [Bacteroidota bacterium]